MDLRVARIISAEKVKDSEKLLRMDIDLGDEQRQIVSGIAEFYEPKALVGKEIIVITNLEPRTIFGLESKGMLLAAGDDDNISLLMPDKDMPPGSKIT